MEHATFPHREALNRAGRHFVSRAAFARAIGVRPQQLDNWLRRDKEIDPAYCSRIERATEGAVSRRDLRPDDWQRIWPELVPATSRSDDAAGDS